MTSLKGGAAEAHQTVDGQGRELPQGVLGPARLAGVAIVIEADLPESEEAAEPANEPTTLREPVERVDDPAIHQAEIAAIERDVEVADQAQDSVERKVSQPLEEALFAAPADGVHDVVAIPPQPEKLRQQFRGVLQIAVHHDDGLSSGMLEPRRDRGLVAEIPTQVEYDDSLIIRVQAVKDVRGGIATAVVDE